jgi:hypothetical protein
MNFNSYYSNKRVSTTTAVAPVTAERLFSDPAILQMFANSMGASVSAGQLISTYCGQTRKDSWSKTVSEEISTKEYEPDAECYLLSCFTKDVAINKCGSATDVVIDQINPDAITLPYSDNVSVVSPMIECVAEKENAPFDDGELRPNIAELQLLSSRLTSDIARNVCTFLDSCESASLKLDGSDSVTEECSLREQAAILVSSLFVQNNPFDDIACRPGPRTYSQTVTSTKDQFNSDHLLVEDVEDMILRDNPKEYNSVVSAVVWDCRHSGQVMIALRKEERGFVLPYTSNIGYDDLVSHMSISCGEITSSSVYSSKNLVFIRRYQKFCSSRDNVVWLSVGMLSCADTLLLIAPEYIDRVQRLCRFFLLYFPAASISRYDFCADYPVDSNTVMYGYHSSGSQYGKNYFSRDNIRQYCDAVFLYPVCEYDFKYSGEDVRYDPWSALCNMSFEKCWGEVISWTKEENQVTVSKSYAERYTKIERNTTYFVRVSTGFREEKFVVTERFKDMNKKYVFHDMYISKDDVAVYDFFFDFKAMIGVTVVDEALCYKESPLCVGEDCFVTLFKQIYSVSLCLLLRHTGLMSSRSLKLLSGIYGVSRKFHKQALNYLESQKIVHLSEDFSRKNIYVLS